MNQEQLRKLIAEFLEERKKPTPHEIALWIRRKYGYKVRDSKVAKELENIGWLGDLLIKSSSYGPVQSYKVNEWQALGKDGKVVNLRQVTANIKPTTDWKEAVRLFIESEVPASEVKVREADGERIAVVSIPDIHVGKLAWKAQTGTAYDTKRAVEAYMQAVTHFLDNMPKDIGRILYIVGNDLVNMDNGRNTTTAGTPQDSDTRFEYAFTRARQMVASSAEMFAEVAPVDMVVQPGNHDGELTWVLGEVVSAYFRNTDGIRVYNQPTPRKYLLYGDILFGVTHGDDVKPQALPGLMLQEARTLLGEARWLEWFLGHLHRKKEYVTMTVNEEHGVRMRYLPSLSGTDKWHASKGYGNVRAAEMYLYRKGVGLCGSVNFNFDPGEDEDRAAGSVILS